MRTSFVWAALLLAAGTARAEEVGEPQSAIEQEQVVAQAPDQQQAPPAEAPPAAPERQQQQPAPAPPRQQPVGPTSDAFNRACIDLLNGRTPEGEEAIRALQDACEKLMSGRAQERISAEERRRRQLAAQEQLRLQAEGRETGSVQSGTGSGAQPGPAESGTGSGVQPGQAAAPVEPGGGVLAAFGQAGSELMGRRGSLPMGMRRSGPVDFTIVTNPVGWFNGLGVNAEIFGAIPDQPKFSWVGGARYSNTDATAGDVSTFGAMAGIDWFIIGRNNEGLRVGPRIEVAAGRQEFGEEDDTFGRLGLSGEVGYNFIASNGITGLVAGGLGGRVAGDEENEDFESFVGGEFGPYLKLGLGFSW